MELIDKSLIIAAERRRSDGGVKSCIIHDLLRDLCLKRCKEEYFLKSVDKNHLIYEKHHRLLVRDVEASGIPLPFGLHTRSLFGYLPNSGVPNMKLLKVLDLRGIASYNYNFYGIKLLVHLRYLAIHCPLGLIDNLGWIDCLVNLEFLVVTICGLFNTIPSVILKMMKLRYVDIISYHPVHFGEECSIFRTNEIEFLGYVSIESLKDEEILKCSPRLRKLKCKCATLRVEETEIFRYPDFGFFTQLESLNVSFIHSVKYKDMAPPNLPLYLKKLILSESFLPWENMSIIGGLPKLQVLKLLRNAFVGEIWETRDDEFQQLTFLKLELLYDLTQWNVPCSQHFPTLRHLVFDGCSNLQEIPSEVGEIGTLQLIKVDKWCKKSLAESARQIEREQRDNGNEKLKVCLENGYWSDDDLSESGRIPDDNNGESE